MGISRGNGEEKEGLLGTIDDAINPQKTCKVCNGFGWVCEDHPEHEWDYEHQDNCGAGMPCICTNIKQLERIRHKLIALRGKNEVKV